MQEIVDRIAKDIAMFKESVGKLDCEDLNGKEKELLELATSYCKDSESWLGKKDFYTAFASISYAHGLLDSLIRLKT